MKGICLRGLPGWGEMFAPLTTVVNTFGGTWFDKDWNAQVERPGVQGGRRTSTSTWSSTHGEPGAAQAGFTECLNALSQGKVAMWYDATSAAGSLEAERLAGRGQDRLRRRRRSRRPSPPAGCTPGPGPWRRPAKAGQRVEVRLLGLEQGVRATRRRQARLGRVPAGKRASHLRNPEYQRRPPPSGRRRSRPSRTPTRRPGRPAAADRRHPVRRHPGVHRLRVDLCQVDEQRDRWIDEYRLGAEPVSVGGAGRGRQTEVGEQR